MEAQSPQDGTLKQLLSQHAAIFQACRQQQSSLPKDDSRAQFPPTFTEAQALVLARDEERRRATARKDKSKQRSSKSKHLHTVEQLQLPGTVPGAEANNTAFWLSTEGFFRDVTAADLALLCPRHEDPLQDPIFALPAPGPEFETEEEKAAREKSSKPAIPLRPKVEPEEQPEVAPADSHSGGTANGNPASDDKQRKSRRLHAKASRGSLAKELEAVPPQTSDPPTPAPDPPQPPQPPPVVEEPAAAVAVPEPPVPAEPEAECLLHSLSQQDTALLASQVMLLTGSEAAAVAAACDVELPQLQGWLAAAGGEGKEMPPEVLKKVSNWVGSQAAALAPEGTAPPAWDLPPAAAVLDRKPGEVSPEQLPETWSAWWQALKSELTAPQAEGRKCTEAVHAYTALMLAHPASRHVLQPDAAAVDTQGVLTPAASGDAAKTRQEPTAESGPQPQPGMAMGSPFTPFPAHPAVGTPQSTAMAPGFGAAQMTSASGPFPPMPAPTEAAAQPLSNTAQMTMGLSGAAPGPRGLAGKKRSGGLADTLLARTAVRAAGRAHLPPIDASRSRAAAAVSAFVAAGPPEGDLEQQWRQLEAAAEWLALGPSDEVGAEMFALHSELLQQMAINQQRAAGVLQAVLQDLPRQAAAAAERQQGIEIAQAWAAKQRAAKRVVKREKREAAQREAAQAAGAILQASPRVAPGRRRGPGGEDIDSRGTSPAPEAPMFDLLAVRGAEDDALCAICGGGESSKELGDEIVFCERCDVAVHQKCYGVDAIPAGEWLCWPCKRFEEAELAAGRSQAEIRPPRWEQGGGRQGSPNKDLAGGGRSVECALCPVKHGAFRQTLDCKRWVHQVCAIWHPETSVREGGACAAIEGVAAIRPERWGVECAVCRRTEGAIIRCNAGHCAAAFHPLCARNNGQHLTTRSGGAGGGILRRAYCAAHSSAQREKDLGHATGLEGSANLVRKEARLRQHLHRANAAAVDAYEQRLEERRVMTRVRLELESLRILLQRINKREKLKREEIRARIELHRGRLAHPNWIPTLPLAPPAEGAAAEPSGRRRGRARLELPRSASMQVDREVMMTTSEVMATNDKLPKGYKYVPIDSLRGASGQAPPQ